MSRANRGGSRGSPPWASTAPDDLGLGDPALAPLLGALTAGPTPDELAGQHAVLAMYRAAHAPGPHAARLRAPARVTGGRARVAGRRARGAYGRTHRGALAAVTSLAVLAGGFAAAGSLAVLPAPLQHAAHWLLRFPDASPGTVAASDGPRHPAHPGPDRYGGNPSDTPGGKPGSTQIQHRSYLGPATRPMPRVSLRLLAGKHNKRGALLVQCQFTAPGDVVWLLVRDSSRHPGGRPSAGWQTEGMARLSKRGKAVFEIRFRVGMAYRVVVLATAAHGRLMSKVIVFTARDLLGRP